PFDAAAGRVLPQQVGDAVAVEIAGGEEGPWRRRWIELDERAAVAVGCRDEGPGGRHRLQRDDGLGGTAGHRAADHERRSRERDAGLCRVEIFEVEYIAEVEIRDRDAVEMRGRVLDFVVAGTAGDGVRATAGLDQVVVHAALDRLRKAGA